ncbi:MAG: hypothetical protein KY439_08255, partial [Actinobacteria bacterium]|nr:hypothetical protein [Actinomycetota bacterium]
GSNHLRRQLNDAAREVRHREGALVGPILLVGGREYQAGDEVVARRNARWLVGEAGEWVKNGSLGTVVCVDGEARTVAVAFDREGHMVVPAEYLEGGHLDHAYARTTYGLQGATVETASYHPTDVSGFEEGYVALTRSREGTAVHLVDGELDSDSELDHHGVDVPVTGTAEVVEALRRRRANILACDVDGTVSQALEFHGWRPPDLDAEAVRLDQLLAGAPPELGEALVRAESRLRGLEARLERQQSSRWFVAGGKALKVLMAAVESTGMT